MIIEKVVKDYLDTKELNIDVYVEIPGNKPQAYYAIQKTGSSCQNMITTSMVVIQSYASTLYNAMLMNEKIKDIMLNSILELNEISSVKLNSDYNYTNPETKEPRYQAVFVITHY